MKYQIIFVCLLFASFVSAQEDFLKIPATYDQSVDIPAGTDVYLNITVGDELGPLILLRLFDSGKLTVKNTSEATSNILPMLEYASSANPSGNTPAILVTTGLSEGFCAISSPPLELNDPSKHIGMLFHYPGLDGSMVISEINGFYDNVTKRFSSLPFQFGGDISAIFAILDNSNAYATSVPPAASVLPLSEAFACTVEEGQNRTFHFFGFNVTITLDSPSIKTLFLAGEEEPAEGGYTAWVITPLEGADMNVSATLTWSFDPASLIETNLRFAKWDETTNELVIFAEGGSANMKDGIVTQTTTSLFGKWSVVGYNGTDPTMDTDSSSSDTSSYTNTNSEDSGESETGDSATSSRSTDAPNTDTTSNVTPSTTTVNGDTSDEDNGNSSSVLVSSFVMTVIAILALF